MPKQELLRILGTILRQSFVSEHEIQYLMDLSVKTVFHAVVPRYTISPMYSIPTPAQPAL